MSRHRNVRNLTEDDYYDYDDYDDYDDDYYEEEDLNDSYYSPPPKSNFQSNQVISQSLQGEKIQNQAKPKVLSKDENIRILERMGFAQSQAAIALECNSNNVEAAANQLLCGTISDIRAHENVKKIPDKPSGSMFSADGKNCKISQPPPGFSLPPHGKKKGGISKPPEGFSIPSEKGGIVKPPHGFAPPSESSFAPSEKDEVNCPTKGSSEEKSVKSSTKAIGVQAPLQITRKEYGPLPRIPDTLKIDISNQKERLSLVVLGHVDAGKSTLMGQVLVQLGNVAKRTVNKYQKQATELGKASFALAWVMDEDDAERERGVTMDIATKHITTPKREFVLLDAPGHADFVPSMITGAAAADVGILVVAATIGEFEAGFDGGGQTREHIILARGLGVSQLIVAVNKLDAVDWDQHRFNEIRAKIEPFLLQNGFVSKRIQFIPVSGLNGTNVKRKDAGESLYAWYKGSTLIEGMDNFLTAQRNVDKPLRVLINDVYSEWNKGITLRCRIVQGVVQVGEKIVVLPIGDEGIVSKIEHGSDTSVNRQKYAVAGDSTEIVIVGVDIARVAIGNIISHPHWELRPPLRRKVQAKIMVMEQLSVPIIRGAQILLHMHSIDVPATISKLISSVNPKKKNSLKERPRVLTEGTSAVVEITFAKKVCVEPYNNCRALGRFVLRRGGDTVAIGIVEKIL
mmetsp:Transcript_23226/g.35165  ORF Transcript_23226/g.35165 Transcript_23226/m.35165 type:complete len:685 (+) Transcript_23226:101-2155(+)|eukprot:CAMPEP_0178910938 /NCGR_PEP_ID=MMETSP0786-20121207/9385_1 /TAXON_ID=186022 /ORGANISM="Thalassionema frauenfeldii, Strain CCMP 1798" /LENGTH=684 /DNA_ID=CAMNT_0020583265 /DNA_START=19 /DNA_END=2073 /DNA_ORIENTATION=+